MTGAAGSCEAAAGARGAAPLDDVHRCAAALAALGASPSTVRRLLSGTDACEAWRLVRSGRHPADPAGRLRAAARPGLPDDMGDRCAMTGTAVLLPGEPGYPPVLAADPEAPAVLFVTGAGAPVASTPGDDSPRIAVVGTRAPSSAGVRVARAMGAGLAAAGVSVVSGLARGIDAAAHDGALQPGGAPPVGVLGAAADAPLAPVDARRRASVASAGVLLSEVAPGTASRRWMFAVRNRIMAALSQAVVVVESHATGGSLHTVRAAVRRGVPVCAVPGSVTSPASAGTNALLVGGVARAVRDAGDVLAAVVPGHRLPGLQARRPGAGAMDARSRAVLGALGGEPASLDRVALGAGLGLGEAAAVLERLADAGLASCEHGWWTGSARRPPR